MNARLDTATLARDYQQVRRRSLMLAEPLSAEDCGAQSMADASPVKWHLAHTTWFFETFILEALEEGFAPFHPAFRVLFNSYYNGIGARHPRAQRGVLTRPALREVLAWRADVDARIARLVKRRDGDPELARLLVLGMHHEQQHQELILTDVKHLLAQSALYPAYGEAAPLAGCSTRALRFVACAGGLADIGHEGGHQGGGFCFDNELPRHRVYVAPFELASRLVTNGEYLEFIDAGGYRDPALWLSEGWDWVGANALAHPLYWMRGGDGAWSEFTLHGLLPLELDRPAAHLSMFEAAAYACWAGARLPTEAEWELGAAALGESLEQLFGHCWQWTSSSYAPYPGYTVASGALGEYNGKFMCNQYVLRGSSMATPPGHARLSYRNFFPAGARWQFTGLRLAR